MKEHLVAFKAILEKLLESIYNLSLKKINMKKSKTSLEELSKDALIENLMLDSIKGGCCTGTTIITTHNQTSRGITIDKELDWDT